MAPKKAFIETDTSYPVVMLPDDTHMVRMWPHLAAEMMPDGKILGELPSMIFLQIEGWVRHNRTREMKFGQSKQHTFRDGNWWMYSSMRDWKNTFCWINAHSTIILAVKRLEEFGLIIIEKTGRYNKQNRDNTYWYRINFDEAAKLKSIRVDNYTPPPPLTDEEPVIPAPADEPLFLEEEESEEPVEFIDITDQAENEVDDEGVARPYTRKRLQADPLFQQIKMHLAGGLAAFTEAERFDFLNLVKRPVDTIDQWWDWCIWQAQNNAKGKPWNTYLQYLYYGMEPLPNGWIVSRDCSFSKWRRGEFIQEDAYLDSQKGKEAAPKPKKVEIKTTTGWA